jgi:hypothetical protein
MGKFVNILEVVRRAVALAASNPGTSVPLDLSIERNEATKKFSVCLWDGIGRQKIRCKQQFDSEEEADVCYHWLEDHIKADGSAAVGTALFVGFPATMAESDFSRPCIIGYSSSPSRCGPAAVAERSIARSPGSRARSVCTCQGL